MERGSPTNTVLNRDDEPLAWVPRPYAAQSNTAPIRPSNATLPIRSSTSHTLSVNPLRLAAPISCYISRDMTRTSRAIVQTAPRTLELRELPLPEIGPDDALLQIEACGICGSDYEPYEGALPVRFPVTPGHEPVGRIAEIGDEAARRWRVQKGDRVCVETLIPCGFCPNCVRGAYTLCFGHRRMNAYGYLSVDLPPGLWGGYADYLYLDPHALVHKIDDSIPPEIATFFNPLGAGFRWAVEMPGLSVGDTIVILGPGQRGLASVIAAREAGAGCIIVTGLAADERKLELARELGAHHAINIEKDDITNLVREATDGRMADVVIDVTSYSVEAVKQAINLA